MTDAPEFIDEMLDLASLEAQTEYLHAKNLLDEAGLEQILDTADGLLGDDPGKARRLAELCADLAEAPEAPAIVPRATYIIAGTHGINGDFEEELRLTKVAYDGYVSLGKNMDALRTHVGRMAALLETGRYERALEAGQTVLDTLNGKGELAVSPTKEQSDLLTALVHGNRGGCYEYMGRYDEALDAYAVAEEKFQALGMAEDLGEVQDNRGIVLLYLGRGSEALAAHEAAATLFDESDLALFRAKALSNIGVAHLQLGNYTRSLDAFEQARRLLGSFDTLTDKHVLLLETANAYLALSLYSEALATYREADDLLQAAGMAHNRAVALWSMGSTMIAQSEFEEAERILAESADLFAAADNAPLLSGVMLEQASLLAACGDKDTAQETAKASLNLILEGDWPVQQIYARLRLADLLLPDVDEAEPHLLEAKRLAELLALPNLHYRLNERLGRLRRLQGRSEEAQELLEAAVDEIERLRGTVAQETMRASFLRDKTAAYEDLLQLHLARNDEESLWHAFAVAERAKSRALVDLLTGVVEKETNEAADPELDIRLRTLQADLNAVYNRLLGGDEGEAPSPNLHGRAVELEQEISRLRLQAATAATTPDPFTAPPPDTAEDQISSDVALLAYHVVGDEIMAFVNACGRIRVVRNLGTVAAVREHLRRLEAQWDRFRAGQVFADRQMKLLERSTQRVLSALYEMLVRPIEKALAEAADLPVADGSPRKLAIVPHGPLHQVPFHALFDGERYLIERFEISYAPSARVFALCQKQATGESEKALVMGVADPLIPAVTDEARAVAKCFHDAEPLIDEEATMAALRSKSSGCGILHLACHGMFRSDNPMFSALKLHDGWMMAADVMQLDLDGSLVTLSACESGRSEVVGGDEVLGLTRAFLGAGAATLVVSLWLVQDETTATLMEKWYEKLRGGAGRATALREAQLEIKEEHPHPYFWAPFVLIGRR